MGIFALFRPQEHWKVCLYLVVYHRCMLQMTFYLQPDWERDFEKKLGSSLAVKILHTDLIFPLTSMF